MTNEYIELPDDMPTPDVKEGEYAGPAGEGAGENLWDYYSMRDYARQAVALDRKSRPSPAEPLDERQAFNAWNNGYDCPISGMSVKSAAWRAWQTRAALKSPAEPLDSPDKDTREAIRNEVLEEAARICDGRFQSLHKSHMHSAATEANKCSMAILSLKSQPAQPSDTEMLDWVTENRAIVDYYGNGYRVCFIDDGSFYPEVYPTIQEAIKAAMRAQEQS